jgi:hypothetical protein
VDSTIAFVHVLVATAFIGPCPAEGMEVNHKGEDGNRANNVASNLEWVTRQVNVRHRFDVLKHGNQKGSAHHNSRLTETDIPQIRAMSAAGAVSTEIAKWFRVGKADIKEILAGKIWSHVIGVGDVPDGFVAHGRRFSHPNSKLSEDDARTIIMLLAQGERGRAIARRFGVTEAAISQIKRKKSWTHIN